MSTRDEMIEAARDAFTKRSVEVEGIEAGRALQESWVAAVDAVCEHLARMYDGRSGFISYDMLAGEIRRGTTKSE